MIDFDVALIPMDVFCSQRNRSRIRYIEYSCVDLSSQVLLLLLFKERFIICLIKVLIFFLFITVAIIEHSLLLSLLLSVIYS